MTVSCPKITRAQLETQCAQIGLSPGDMVMAHASLRCVGEILGGPDVLIDAILQAIGADGTLMVYVGCQLPFDDVGRGIFDRDAEAFILENCPTFDPTTARASRDFGALSELFRTRPGVVCSGNPGCRMAASGARADWLTQNHPLNYGLGENSPLERLCQAKGKVLLLGSDPDAVTLLHYAEALAPIPDKKKVHIKARLLVAGERTWVDIEEFNSSTGIRDWKDRFFADIVQLFLSQSLGVSGTIGNATAHLLDANRLVEFAIPIMVAEAKRLDESQI